MHWSATCYSPAGSVGRNLEERIQKQLVAVIQKASRPCCRPAALEAPWRNGKTERAGKDWMEDYYKMTQDGPGAQTWTDSEEDCDAVNQARTSKINDSGYSAYQHVFGRNPPQMEDAILECGGADLGVVSRKQTGELAQERSMTMRRIALQESLALNHKRRWKRVLHHVAKKKKNKQRFLAPGCSNQQHVGHGLDCIPWFCSQVCTIPGTTVY